MGCFDAISKNPFVRLMKRIAPIFLAFWYFADIGLDINQSITYYEMAFDVNGSYRRWALKYQNDTNSTYLHTVSPWYLYVASIVWIGPSCLFAVLFSFFNLAMMACCECLMIKCGCLNDCTCGTRIGIIILLLPFTSVISFFVMTLYLPVSLLCTSARKLIEGDNYDEKKQHYCLPTDEALIFIKLFEIFGEALPQLILNTVFISNNYPYLIENDIYFGIPVPMSIISVVFSFGSILIGIKAGCCCLCENS